MKTRPLGLRLAIGLLALFALWSFGSCDSVFGSDDDDSGGGSGGAAEATSWIRVNETSVEHPFGGTYRIAIIDKNETQMTIIFYQETGDGVNQVAGGVLPYEVNGEDITFVWSHAWFDEDPGVQGITYTGTDWYEIPAGAEAVPTGGTVQITGDTLTVEGGAGAQAFTKIDFALPADMVDTWDSVAGDLVLGAESSDAPVPGWGSLSFTFGTQEGSGFWKASGTTDGYFRQIYTGISDNAGLEYWEHLNPYELTEDTFTVYQDLDKTEEDSLEYVRQ